MSLLFRSVLHISKLSYYIEKHIQEVDIITIVMIQSIFEYMDVIEKYDYLFLIGFVLLKILNV